MICPHCEKDIPDTTVAKHLASKGGKASKRVITPEQQAKMQDACRKYYEAYRKKGEKP
jgi:Spy/CpxP family protein refolding chaperone